MINRSLAFIPPRTAFVIIAVFLALIGGGIATVESASENHAKVEIISDVTPSPHGPSLSVGILFHLDPGWHVYWQNPGDSGEPPKIEWQLPPGFQAGPIEWPRPIRLGGGSVVDYGYENQVLLIAPIYGPRPPGAPTKVPITADVKYVVCREICIPGKARLSLPIPSNHSSASQWHDVFQRTRAQFPKPAPADWNIFAQSDKDYITLSVRGHLPAHDVTFFPLDPSVIDNAAPQTLSTSPGGFHLKLQTSQQLVAPPAKLRGLVQFADRSTYQISAPVTQR